MGVYRTYFDKNNTIIGNSQVNTGKNPISELYYGEQKSRFLFYCSFDEIKAKFDNKVFNTNNVKHYLVIKNTSNFDITQTLSVNNDIVFTDKYRPTSFDLELKPIKQIWDEGNGYDFALNLLASSYPEDNTYTLSASNWFNGTNATPFLTPGGVLGTLIATQHFDSGNEDVMMDITDFVNELLVSGVTTGITSGTTSTGLTYSYQGFCLKYSDYFESATNEFTYALGLNTKYTPSFFEPFIQTVYDDTIIDDRTNFYLNKINRLYLYVNVNGQMTNLDVLPTCSINGTGYTVTHQTTGVYYATIPATGDTFDSYVSYYDVWSNVLINGISRPNIRMTFVPKEDNDYYQMGSTIMEPVPYGISVSGIKQDEKIKQGNTRVVFVHMRKPFTVSEQDVLTHLNYRLYVKQGSNQVSVLDWQPVNKTYNSNSFNIDTTWMVPQTYYIDVKLELNGQTMIYNEALRFTVPSNLDF